MIYLNETVQHRSKTGTDGMGRAAFAEPKDIRARWTTKSYWITSREGKEIRVRGLVLLDWETSEVKVGDVLVRHGQTYTVVEHYLVYDVSGTPTHVEVMVA